MQNSRSTKTAKVGKNKGYLQISLSIWVSLPSLSFNFYFSCLMAFYQLFVLYIMLDLVCAEVCFSKSNCCKNHKRTMNVIQCFSHCGPPWIPSFPPTASPPFPPHDKRIITLDTIYTQDRGLPLPFHQYQHLKFIKLWGRPLACNFRSP